MNYVFSTLLLGIGATVVMDIWSVLRKSLLGIAPPNYASVGRWIAHMAHGQFHHEAILKSPAMRGERLIGWTAHYLIGVAFAGLLMLFWGPNWLAEPTVAPALVIGIGTVLAPFLLMQPGMGAGIAASRTPRPNAARLQSVISHAVFGLGLYLTGLALQGLPLY